MKHDLICVSACLGGSWTFAIWTCASKSEKKMGNLPAQTYTNTSLILRPTYPAFPLLPEHRCIYTLLYFDSNPLVIDLIEMAFVAAHHSALPNE